MQDEKEIKETILESEDASTDSSIENVETNEDSTSSDLNVKKEKISRKEKRKRKLMKNFFDETDIKYSGPLTYRYLRIIAWIAMAITQFLVINSISGAILESPLATGGWAVFLSLLSNLSVPLFFIAVMGTIINKSKSYKSIIIFYTALYLVIGLSVVLIFNRYFAGIYGLFAEENSTVSLEAGKQIGKKFEINVFSDLLMLSLFNFFIEYQPKKYFQEKKIYIFRALALLPIAYVIASYIIKINTNLGRLDLPFEIYPFLTTKPPLLYAVFIAMALWIKNRERKYIKLGGTYEGYDNYLKTNKNSLKYSKALSIFLLIISIVDIILSLIFGINYYLNGGEDITGYLKSIEMGDCVSLFLAIPFVMLYSYTKVHKESKYDLFVPLAGIGLIVFVYVESIYEIVIKLIH